jgi:hypothetical protein
MSYREISVMEVRRDNLRKLIPQWGGAVAIATKLGHAGAAFITQMAGPNPTREMSEKQARKIESKLDLPRGWLDSNHNDGAEGGDKGELKIGLDERRLETCLNEVFKSCEKHNVQPTPEKFAKIVVMVYTSDTSALNMAKYTDNIVAISA